MKRGDIVIGRAPGEFTSKARLSLVVQSDETVADSATVSLCPVTSQLSGHGLVRVQVNAGAGNGLKRNREIEVDLITTMRKSRIDDVIGAISADVIGRVDIALMRWLPL